MYHFSFSILLTFLSPCICSPLLSLSLLILITSSYFFCRLNRHKTFRHNVIRCRRTERRYYNSTNYEFTMSEIIPSCRRTKLWRQEGTRLEKEDEEGIKCRPAWNFVGARFSSGSLGIWVTRYGKSREDSRWRLSPKLLSKFPVEEEWEREGGSGNGKGEVRTKMEKQRTVYRDVKKNFSVRVFRMVTYADYFWK